MTRDCPLQPKGMAWTLDLPQETLSPPNSHCSALLVAQLPRDNQTSSQFRHRPSQGCPLPNAWGSGPRDTGGPWRSPRVPCARGPTLGHWRGRSNGVPAGVPREGCRCQQEGQAGPQEEWLCPTSSPSHRGAPAAAQHQSLASLRKA